MKTARRIAVFPLEIMLMGGVGLLMLSALLHASIDIATALLGQIIQRIEGPK